jgi:hypothetical protein
VAQALLPVGLSLIVGITDFEALPITQDFEALPITRLGAAGALACPHLGQWKNKAWVQKLIAESCS